MPADERDFLTDFHHSMTFGATENNGVERQAGTPEHGQLRDWFRSLGEQAGFTAHVDPIGNLFLTKEWVSGADYAMLGSHLDSQPLAGRFDGVYGVIAALHAAIALDREVSEGMLRPTHNICVVDWFNEEGARFAPSIMGSSVYAGLFDLTETLQIRDPQGVTVAEALDSIGYRGTEPGPRAAAYAEVHIEQGRVLEREGVPIGAVDRSWHTQKLNVEVLGEQSHTGATIMSDRHDALVAAARVVLMAEEVVEDFEPETIVTSVGKFDVRPNSPIVVPRQVSLVIDLRADAEADVNAARDTLKRRIAELAQERDITIEVRDFDIRPIQYYPEEGLELTEKAARDAGLNSRRLRTMAGHDSVPMNRIVPTVMIFVPSVDGVSHCEREFSRDEDLVSGLHLITQVATRLVQGELDGTAVGGAR